MEEKFKYLYLDDNDKITRDGDVEFLNSSSNRIEIITDYPGSWNQRAESIMKDIQGFDGVILDWELTNKSEISKKDTQQAENVDFSAESLAEHLRVSVVKNKVKDIPLILCSADKNKAFSYIQNRELTRKDLFDLTFLKSDLFDKKVSIAESQLYDLAISYTKFSNNKYSISDILGLKNEDIENLDLRFVDILETILTTKTTHDLVQFLLKELIEREGLLINELVLAARLGVNISKSKGWPELLNILNPIKYTGILGVAWVNYWAFKLERWWNDNIGIGDLRTTGASERVKLIIEKFGIELVSADKIKYCSSDEYWTICFGLKQPLDPVNGYLIGDGIDSPWLDGEYVSALAELEKENSECWRINIMDRERFNSFKSFIVEKK